MNSSWSCLLDSFSIVLDIPAELIIKSIGHDGSEILWPGFNEPYCRKGFHPQELIDYCYENGYYTIPIEAMPSSLPMSGKKVFMKPHLLMDADKAYKRIKKYLQVSNGVIVISNDRIIHAVAWINGQVKDPANRFTNLDTLEIMYYFLITKSNQNI